MNMLSTSSEGSTIADVYELVAAVGMLTFVVADTWPALRAWFATVF